MTTGKVRDNRSAQLARASKGRPERHPIVKPQSIRWLEPLTLLLLFGLLLGLVWLVLS